MKVIDECLRAASGFKGADDLLEHRLLDMQLMSNTTREKRVSSAPSHEFDISDSPNKDLTDYSSAVMQWSEVIQKHLPLAICHCAPMVRAAAFNCFAGLTSSVFSMLKEDMQESIISSAVSATLNGEAPSIKSAACRAIGVLASFSQIVYNGSLLNKLIRAVEFNTHDPTVSVRITASWALANICDSLRHRAIELQSEIHTGDASEFEALSLIVETALQLTKDCDKVQWNVCHALSNLFMNDTLKLHDMHWAPTVYSILLLLIRDSTNFKIRIHAAVALAVPVSRLDYGSSFSDVVQGLEHVLESLRSHQSMMPSSFKYKNNLEKQLNLTTLHVLGFVSLEDGLVLKDFFLKKAHFFEGWFKFLCLSVVESQDQPMASMVTSTGNPADESAPYLPKEAMVYVALKSLYNIYKYNKNHDIAERFGKLISMFA